MANPGAYPVDYTTPVGQLRGILGDVASVPLVPPVANEQDYSMFSDKELGAYIAASTGSDGTINYNRAAQIAILSLIPRVAILGERAIKDFDLSVDDRGRAAQLIALAKYYGSLADDDDAASVDSFLIVPTGKDAPAFTPEASPFPYPYGRSGW